MMGCQCGTDGDEFLNWLKSVPACYVDVRELGSLGIVHASWLDCTKVFHFPFNFNKSQAKFKVNPLPFSSKKYIIDVFWEYLKESTVSLIIF